MQTDGFRVACWIVYVPQIIDRLGSIHEKLKRPEDEGSIDKNRPVSHVTLLSQSVFLSKGRIDSLVGNVLSGTHTRRSMIPQPTHIQVFERNISPPAETKVWKLEVRSHVSVRRQPSRQVKLVCVWKDFWITRNSPF